MATPEESAGSTHPAVAPELLETIRAVVGELLGPQIERGFHAAGSASAGPSRFLLKAGRMGWQLLDMVRSHYQEGERD